MRAFKCLDDSTIQYQGITGLWLKILVMSLLELDSQFPEQALHYIFDPDNQFFDFAASRLDCQPEALRAGIKKRMKVMP